MALTFDTANLAGVYRIRNLKNGKCYYGSAVCFRRRRNTHLHLLRGGRSPSRKLQAAWNKYGESSFEFDVVVVSSRQDAVMYEQLIIDAFDAVNSGYNICPVAGSVLGMKQSKESVEASASKRRGVPISLEARLKISAAHKWRKHSPEHVKKVADSNRGKKRSAAQVEALRNSQRGKVLSESTKQILREQRLGVLRPEVGQAISKAKKDKVFASKCTKLTATGVAEIKQLLQKGHGVCELARMFGVSQPAISNIKSGRSWGYLAC